MSFIRNSIIAAAMVVFALTVAAGADIKDSKTSINPYVVNYKYAPSWWQTLVCMPGDPQKTMVGREGGLLYGFTGNGRYHGFTSTISADLDGGTQWVRQELISPCIPIVRTTKRLGSVEMVEDAFSIGPPMKDAPRRDILIIRLHNEGRTATSISPVLLLQNGGKVDAATDRRTVSVGQSTVAALSEPYKSSEKTKDGILLRFSTAEVASGAYYLLAVSISGDAATPKSQFDMVQAEILRGQAESFWTKLDLSCGAIQVPDPEIQALLDSSIRNIYQSRTSLDGSLSFCTGPTTLQGLSTIDAVSLSESLTYIGRIGDARGIITRLLACQRNDGGFQTVDGNWKETGAVLWAVAHHAALTGDKKWLESVWPSVEKGVDFIRNLRISASKDPGALNFGLVPNGIVGSGPSKLRAEYTNVYWSMIGLHSAIDSARRLGRDSQVSNWQSEYDAFTASFLMAAERDVCADEFGNKYLPVRMKDDGKTPPEKSQRAFLQAVFPGRIFSPNDILVTSNLAMLESHESEGLVPDTDSLSGGFCPEFTSSYGQAWLWQGRGDKASRVLYAGANHASPLYAWWSEQMPLGNGDQVAGDMPCNCSGAEIIPLVRNMLVLERGTELHLLEGLPSKWVMPGSATQLKNVPTEFGPVSLSIWVSPEGRDACIKFTPPARVRPSRIVLHLGGWSGKPGTLDLSATVSTTKRIKLSVQS